MSFQRDDDEIGEFKRFSLFANSSSTGVELDRWEDRRERSLDLASEDPSRIAERVRSSLEGERNDMLDKILAKLSRMYRIKKPKDEGDD